MTATSKITDYLGANTAASRPVAPLVPTGGAALYIATDTHAITFYDGSAWQTVPATQTEFVNAQVGTTYTVLSTDLAKLVTFSNGSAIGVTLPQATTAGFGSGFFFDAADLGAGTVTITPTTSTIDGAATLTLTTNQGVRIVSDGANYFSVRGRAPTSGTVTSVATGTGLTGGTITGTGTISLAAIADHDVLANTSGGSAAPIATTVTALIDNAIGSTQGQVLYRGASVWSVLATSTSGFVLQTGGAAANPSWVIQNWTATAVTALGDGVAVSSGSVQADHQASQAVSTGTATVTPASGTSSVAITLSSSTTLTIANGNYSGQHLRLKLIQDGSGSHTVAFDSSVKFGTDITSFTASTAANAIDIVQLIWDNTNSRWMFAAVAHGF